jgi:predicted DNA-binding protein (MmcQ/YjbR family)
VGWHIVCTFQRMLVLRTVLWNQAIEDGFHINPHVWITVLIDAQSATRMLREDVHDARLR